MAGVTPRRRASVNERHHEGDGEKRHPKQHSSFHSSPPPCIHHQRRVKRIVHRLSMVIRLAVRPPGYSSSNTRRNQVEDNGHKTPPILLHLLLRPLQNTLRMAPSRKDPPSESGNMVLRTTGTISLLPHHGQNPLRILQRSGPVSGTPNHPQPRRMPDTLERSALIPPQRPFSPTPPPLPPSPDSPDNRRVENRDKKYHLPVWILRYKTEHLGREGRPSGKTLSGRMHDERVEGRP